jgi:carbonic anhydrase/acetyltransferase-like protein (isoleucine patch superfamily)
MGIYALGDLVPDIDPEAFVHPDATIIGAVTIGAYASIWPGAVVRGDYGPISIGARTSIQDGVVVQDAAAVAAAALVVEDTVVPSGCVAMGVPARCRPAPHVTEWVEQAVPRYADLGRRYRRELRLIR